VAARLAKATSVTMSAANALAGMDTAVASSRA
jgi:hypothetical protein